MSEEYDNEKKGALFKNKKKETESKPDYKGSCEIEGIQYWMNSWINTSKAGEKYMSLSFTPKEENQGQQAESKYVPPDDDDIPF